jgi:eukaryotic-like serine/threonine-protein kinase
MMREPTEVRGLLAAVADGWPQDWDALETTAADERTRRALRRLRGIAAIASFHRRAAETERHPHADRGNGAEFAEEAPTLGGAHPRGRGIPTDARWGRFRLLEKIGEGGYGDVYRAHDTQLDREVALKLLKPARVRADSSRRLLHEGRMLARVRHPNVVAVYDVGEQDGRVGLWMELVRGATLEDLLRSRGPMSAGEAALVGQDVCRALAAVHAAGLVHRDVKTANVMREIGGRLVLMDFGAGGYRRSESRHQFAGTPQYAAPEVCAGGEATVRSDIYSLGVVLFRLVTRAYPRDVRTLDDLVEAHTRGASASLGEVRPDLPEAFVAVVEQTLALDPEERPESAGALRKALGLVLGASSS